MPLGNHVKAKNFTPEKNKQTNYEDNLSFKKIYPGFSVVQSCNSKIRLLKSILQCIMLYYLLARQGK